MPPIGYKLRLYLKGEAMEIEIKIKSDDPEALRRMLSADNAYSALWEIGQHLRSEWNYNDDAPVEYLETLRDRVSDIITEAGVNMEDYK